MNKVKALLLIALFCITIPTFAYDFESDGIYYDITSSSDRTVGVTFKSSDDRGYSGSVTIPSTVTYNGTKYSVKSIEFFAFQGCTNLTSISIPKSVIEIGAGALQGCTGLTSISIPSSVESIGYYALQGCRNLSAISVDSSSSFASSFRLA